MSPLLIGGLLAAGLVVLVSIGLISQGLERARLERARKSAEIAARIKIGNSVMANLPGQFFPAELGNLLLSIEIKLLQKLASINNNAPETTKRLEESKAQLQPTQQRACSTGYRSQRQRSSNTTGKPLQATATGTG